VLRISDLKASVTEQRYNRGLHLLAVLATAATFPLIFMGGLVTSHGAGMAVPDWPNTYGYNMFLFPPSQWVGGIFYEHTHRLMGTVVGMLAIALCFWAWRTRAPRQVRWLATGVLGAVIFQGVLGGLRVVLVKLDLAVVHACFAQAFFCLAALTAVVTSRWWLQAPDLTRAEDAAKGRRLVTLAATAVAVVYLQLVVGALMRHYDAGLAIPDLPLAYGKVLPPTDAAGLAEANAMRDADPLLRHVTLAQVWLHFGHRLGAVLVTAALLATAACVFRLRRAAAGLFTPAVLLLVLLAAQVTLGVLTVLWRKPADLASAHVAVGALVLVTVFVLTVRAAKLYSPGRRSVRSRFMISAPGTDRAPARASLQVTP
jgi:heme a synthase